MRLEQLSGLTLTALYHQLEKTGRVDGNGGLSARTVRYVHTIIHAALRAAVKSRLLSVNPADDAEPPSTKEARSPEMKVWTAEEMRAFLAQRAEAGDELLIAWTLMLATGMRRGEALALRWGDVDFDGARLSVRRAVLNVKHKAEKEELVFSTPKSGKPRVVDLAPSTLAALKAHKAAQGTISLNLARDHAYVLAGLDGDVRNPDLFSQRFIVVLKHARAAVGEDNLTRIRLHDLRHTHATLLLKANVPVKVVSERLGHASAMITLGVYAHVMPGMQAEAASKFGELLDGQPEAGQEQDKSPGEAT